MQGCRYFPKLYGLVKNPTFGAIAMQYVGDLVLGKSETIADALKPNNLVKLDWVKVCLTLCRGLNALHKAGYIHADLKLDNVMIHRQSIRSSHQVKLIDFGFSRPIRANPKPLSLTEEEKLYYSKYCWHIAPEVIQCISGHTVKSDIYSLGEALMTIGSETRVRTIYRCGQWCKAHDPEDRPDIKWVISRLVKLKRKWMDTRANGRKGVAAGRREGGDRLGRKREGWGSEGMEKGSWHMTRRFFFRQLSELTCFVESSNVSLQW